MVSRNEGEQVKKLKSCVLVQSVSTKSLCESRVSFDEFQKSADKDENDLSIFLSTRAPLLVETICYDFPHSKATRFFYSVSVTVRLTLSC